MTIESQRQTFSFIRRILNSPPRQVVEEAASESHETRRIPDPWVYLNRNGKLTTPKGIIVEEKVEKRSYLGRMELQAILEIQERTNQKKRGTIVWFSPPFPSNKDRPCLKIMISEIINFEGKKILFNRALVFDVDTPTLLSLANSLTKDKFENPEYLRSTPLFPTDYEFEIWFKKLSEATSQGKLIEKGEDLRIKNRTYKEMEEIRVATISKGRIPTYINIYQEANRQGLIGRFLGSCGEKTAFDTLLGNALFMRETKTLRCTCPYCHTKVSAIITRGKIFCPNCGKSAEYHC